MNATAYKTDTTSAIVSRQDWDRAKDTLTIAAGLAAKERTRLIEGRFPNEPNLRDELLSMLAVHDKFKHTLSLSLAPTQPASAVEEVICAGTLYGPYRVIRLIGAGGMGQVFVAEDTRLGRRVALKSLAGFWANSSTARQRLLREARTAAALSHPHIATLYDILETEQTLLLVMEYVEGRTAGALRAEAPIPLGQAVRLTIQISEALTYAHDRGIIHCDLKPANVQVTPDGAAKVLDFGLARARYDRYEGDADTASHDVMLIGTPAYMPPERLLHGTLNVSGDIYSLGITLFEMITGRLPFNEPDFARLVGAIIGTAPPAVSSLAAGTPAALDAVVARALARDPKERYQSPREFGRDLQDVLKELDGESGVKTPAAAPSRQPAWPDSRTLLAASLTVAMIVGVTFLGFITSTVYGSPLGLTMSFEGESPLWWPVWGLRSLILPLGQILVVFIPFAVASQLWRLALAAVGPPRRWHKPFLEWHSKLAERAQAIPIRALAGALLTAHVAALAFSIWWGFADLFHTLVNNLLLNSGSLVALSPAYAGEHKVYMRAFSLLVLGFAWGWYRLLRTKSDVFKRIGATTLVAATGLMVVNFVLLTAPYRLFFHSKGERVSYQSQPCYLVGKNGNDGMLFCPAQEAPWSRLVNLSDPALTRTGSQESIFSPVGNASTSQEIP